MPEHQGTCALAERALQLPAVPERGGHVHPVPRAAERVVEAVGAISGRISNSLALT